MSDRGYEAPTVADYGDLLELTTATTFSGMEDGGAKNEAIHMSPSSPASP